MSPPSASDIRVSVVVPAFDAAASIVACVESVLAQIHPASEIFVVDDGSSDATAELVRETFGDKVVVLQQANAGVASARNRGWQTADGDWVAFLDSDDTWEPHHLQSMSAFMGKKDLALIAAGRESHNDEGESHGVFHPADPLTADAILRQNTITTSGVAVRRSVLEQLGGFRTFSAQCEDWDLWVRVLEKGPGATTKQPTVHYVIHEGSATQSRSDDLLEENLKVIEEAKVRGFYEEATLIEAKANAYEESAIRFLLSGRRFKAANHLQRAIRLAPTPKRATLVAATLTPRPALDLLRRLRHRLKRLG